MPVIPADTYKPGEAYAWLYDFHPDYEPVKTIVRDGSAHSRRDGAPAMSHKASNRSLRFTTSKHARTNDTLPRRQVSRSTLGRGGTSVQSQSLKNSLPARRAVYAAKTSHPSGPITATPGMQSPTSPPFSFSSSSSSSSSSVVPAPTGRLSSAADSLSITVKRPKLRRSSVQAIDARTAKQSHSPRSHHSKPTYEEDVSTGSIVRVDADCPPYHPNSISNPLTEAFLHSTGHARNGPRASLYDYDHSFYPSGQPKSGYGAIPETKNSTGESPKPKRTFLQRIGWAPRGMVQRPLAGRRHPRRGHSHSTPHRQARGSHHYAPPNTSRGHPSHESWKFWKGWFKKRK